MNCERCAKRLSRKTARQIDGVVMCSTCMFARPITDCGADGGCEECDVCRYLNFLEWVGSVGKPDGSTVQRDARLDTYLCATYPDTFPPAIADGHPKGGDRLSGSVHDQRGDGAAAPAIAQPPSEG